MIAYKRLSELPIEELVQLWNRGFEGYFVNVQMTADRMSARIEAEDLELEHSIAMYADGRPIGFVVNGFRILNGKKTAWNGGTGIIPEYRGKGFGKKLMERNLELLMEFNAEVAILEALSQNEHAIALYRSVGYEVADRLVYMQNTESLDCKLLEAGSSSSSYATILGKPEDVSDIPFYRTLSAWQTQWKSLRNGNSLKVLQGDSIVGYALYKKIRGEGTDETIVLYQCEAAPGKTDEEEILKAALHEVFEPYQRYGKRMTVNLRASNTGLIDLLQRLGFQTTIEQVHMMLKY